MKKTVLLFSGALLSFLVLAFLDEHENLARPLLDRWSGKEVQLPSPADVESRITRTIERFNETLSRAYLSSNPALLGEEPMDGRVRADTAADIGYLYGKGKVMDVRVKDTEIRNIEGASPFFMRVETEETVTVRYLDDTKGNTVRPYPPVRFMMRYSLKKVDGEWIVTSFETVSVEGPVS